MFSSFTSQVESGLENFQDILCNIRSIYENIVSPGTFQLSNVFSKLEDYVNDQRDSSIECYA